MMSADNRPANFRAHEMRVILSLDLKNLCIQSSTFASSPQDMRAMTDGAKLFLGRKGADNIEPVVKTIAALLADPDLGVPQSWTFLEINKGRRHGDGGSDLPAPVDNCGNIAAKNADFFSKILIFGSHNRALVFNSLTNARYWHAAHTNGVFGSVGAPTSATTLPHADQLSPYCVVTLFRNSLAYQSALPF